MEDFTGKIAVVTGGGTGMGRELVLQLIQEGAHVAMCDVSEENMAETQSLAVLQEEQRLTAHACDVGDEAQMANFRDEVAQAHDTTHINLLFNNAGIGGGGSFIEDSRESWERTFGVCWYGVYYGCRAFMPMLIESSEGHLINTSSVNGFWASIGPDTPHTSYCAAKFAVKGFTEALVTELRILAPHVHCSVVMPGHIGTSIVINSAAINGGTSVTDMSDEDVDAVRRRMQARGVPVDNVPAEHIRQMVRQQAEAFRDRAPTTAAQAAQIILQGIRDKRWRILVGDDAYSLDEIVRDAPEEAYEPTVQRKMRERGHFGALVSMKTSEDEED